MNSPVIDLIKPTEAARLRRIFKQAVATDFNYFPEHYQREVLDQHRTWRLARAAWQPDRLLLAAKVSSQIVGFMIGSRPPQGPAQVYWLYVAPEFRSGGVGGRLLRDSLQRLKADGARQVALATYRHHDYYARKGFKVTHKEEQFPGIVMHIMSKDLDDV